MLGIFSSKMEFVIVTIAVITGAAVCTTAEAKPKSKNHTHAEYLCSLDYVDCTTNICGKVSLPARKQCEVGCAKEHKRCLKSGGTKFEGDSGSSNPPKGTGNRPPTGGGVVSDPSRPPKGTGGHVPPRGGVISEPKGPPRGVGNSVPFGNSIRSNPGPGSGSSGPILKGSPGGRR
jgi:hypothetical protein